MNLPSGRSIPFHQSTPCRRKAACALVLSIWCATASADDGYWSHVGGGSWANGGNWDEGTVADGTDNTAYFGFKIFADIPSSATFTLDGARTIGNIVFTDASGPDTWSLNTGSGGPLTLDYTFDTPSISVGLASQTVTINAVLAGADGLEKLGPGTLILAATNQYTGQTIVSQGTLLLTGQIGADGVDVASGTLGGSGVINGPVIVESGGILAPGGSLTTLSISNILTLQPGSKTLVDVNASTLAHDTIQGPTTVTYGGTLIVSNLSGTFAPGQSYPIFSASSASGNFAGIIPNPGSFLRWRFTPASGVLSVVSSLSTPVFTALGRADTNMILQVANGSPGATAYLLGTTNVTLSLATWSRLVTNSFDVSGNLTFTNTISPNSVSRFYRVAVPAQP